MRRRDAYDKSTKINTLVILYTTADNLFQQGVMTKDECLAIRYATDAALERIRGESETTKRQREQQEAYPK